MEPTITKVDNDRFIKSTKAPIERAAGVFIDKQELLSRAQLLAEIAAKETERQTAISDLASRTEIHRADEKQSQDVIDGMTLSIEALQADVDAAVEKGVVGEPVVAVEEEVAKEEIVG